MPSLYVTFVIRLQLDGQNSIVSGQISHVGNQETNYFRDLDQAMSFIKKHLVANGDPQGKEQLRGSAIFPEGDTGDANRN